MTHFINHVILPQYGIRKGLKVFGGKGVDIIKKETQQFHDQDVLSPIDAKLVTKE